MIGFVVLIRLIYRDKAVCQVSVGWGTLRKYHTGSGVGYGKI